MKILIADDDMLNLEFITMTMNQLGHQCIKCSNGKEAFDTFLQEDFDLLISDISMPVMDGIQLIKEIRKLPDFKSEIPIAVITGYSENKKEISELGYHIDLFLSKPLSYFQIKSKLAKLFDKNKEIKNKEKIPEKKDS